jgi:hypothetical protein
MHFNNGSRGPATAQNAPSSPRSTLRDIIGPQSTDAQISALLREAGSVQAAADMFFEGGHPSILSPATALPPGPAVEEVAQQQSTENPQAAARSGQLLSG